MRRGSREFADRVQYLEDNVLVSDYQALPAFVKSIVADVISVGTAGQPRSPTEPKLMPCASAQLFAI